MELDKDIIESFLSESNTIIIDLRKVIEVLEDHEGEFPKSLLEEFANKSDRIMGTAKTFEVMNPNQKVFAQIGKFGELCKATGYKASTLNNQKLVPLFAAFWADTVDLIDELCQNIGDDQKVKEITDEYAPILYKRLMWLAHQIVTLTKDTETKENSTINVDGLLKKLGIEV